MTCTCFGDPDCNGRIGKKPACLYEGLVIARECNAVAHAVYVIDTRAFDPPSAETPLGGETYRIFEIEAERAFARIKPWPAL